MSSKSSNLFILVLFAIFSEVGYALLSPLYPFIAKERGVSDSVIGLVFSSFAISNFITTIATPYIIKIIGRKNTLYISLITESICTICFGLISFITNKNIFISLSFVIRFAQGAGGAVVQTLIYSLTAASSSSQNIEKNFGYIELGCSIGVAIGPLFASVGYYLFGFEFPFIFAGFLEMFLAFFIKDLIIEESAENENGPSVMKILTNINILMTFLAVMVDMISLSFIYPVFATHLNKKFLLSPEIISLFFIIETITYFISLQVLNKINKMFGNKLTITIGTLMNGAFILFLSPNRFLPQKISLVIIGLGGLGVSGALVSIPAMVDIIGTMKNELKIEEHIAQDYSSAIFNLGYFFGETLGPLAGGALSDKYGFEGGCNFNSGFNILFGIIYSLFLVMQLKEKRHSILGRKKKDMESANEEYLEITKEICV